MRSLVSPDLDIDVRRVVVPQLMIGATRVSLTHTLPRPFVIGSLEVAAFRERVPANL